MIEDPLVHHGNLPARTVTEPAAAIDSFPDAVLDDMCSWLAAHVAVRA